MPDPIRSGTGGGEAELPPRLRLPRRFSVYPVGPGEFRVQSAAQNVSIGVLRHPQAFLALAEGAVDGFDTAALLSGLEAGAREELGQVLRLLMDRGILVEGGAALPDGAAAAPRYDAQRLLFSHFDSSGSPAPSPAPSAAEGLEVQERLCGACVAVLGLGQAGSAVARALCLAGVGRLRLADAGVVWDADVWSGAFYDRSDVGRSRAAALAERLGRVNEHVRAEPASWSPDDAPGAVRPLVEGCSLVVLCPDAFRPPAYETVNQACLDAGTPWINRRVLGLDVTVGPLVVPGQSPCYRCFDLRLLGNLTDPEERRLLHQYLERGTLHTGAVPVAEGVELLVTECLKRLSGITTPSTLGHVVFFSLAGDEARRRPLLRIPRCPACGRGVRHERPTIDPWAHA